MRAQSLDAETAAELWTGFRDKIRKIQSELDKDLKTLYNIYN